MTTSDRRRTRRFGIPVPLVFKQMDRPSSGERFANAIDVSTTGVYFTTNQVLGIGETIEVRLNIPRRVSGIASKARRFVGRVTRVDPKLGLNAESGVGVHLLYWERDRVVPQPESAWRPNR